MQEIKSKTPKLRNKRITSPTGIIRTDLRTHYENKLKRYESVNPHFFNQELRWLFPEITKRKQDEKASQYIRRVRNEINDVVSRWTSEYKYRVNEVLEEMIKRSDKLKLRVTRNDEEMKPEIIACVTRLVMHKIQRGGFHISL